MSRRVPPILAIVAALAALAGPRPALANPGLEGIRNLSVGDATRASAIGVAAYFANPAAMSLGRRLEIQSNYQAAIERNTHGFGVAAVDSMNSSRVALGLGYSSMIGVPRIAFEEAGADAPHELRLAHRANEVGLGISVTVVKGWLSIGIKPKYQSSTLRFYDDDDARRDAQATFHAFGFDAGAVLSILGWVNLAVVGYNLSGPKAPAYTGDRELNLDPYAPVEGSVDHRLLPRISDYPRAFSHGLAVFPLRRLNLSFNLDTTYDFTSFADQGFVRKTVALGGEYVLGKLALRAGGGWDSRGRGVDDDRGYVAGGLGFLLGAEPGKVGAEATLGFRRQVSGPLPETFVGANLGISFNPGY
ncbi:MAG: hypothetical protein H6710_15620 [Myxococcales bacterium]|nr:hypothetical protein [Myxococcales bacterium]MCB9706003.1 hypothetical protein [Myxococcales bacterium]